MDRVFSIANTGCQEGLDRHLNFHNTGKMSYQAMSRGLADSFDPSQMNIAYGVREGLQMLVESIGLWHEVGAISCELHLQGTYFDFTGFGP